MNNKWIRLTEYAQKYHVSQSAIYSAISAGRLPDNRKRGRQRRVDASVDIRANSRRNKTPDDISEKIAIAKLKKIEGEAAILEQRSVHARQRMIEDAADKFFAAFEKAFAPFREKLIALKMTAECLDDFIQAFNSCLAEFGNELEKQLQGISDD